MYIRARMDAYLDPSAGKLDTISAEPLRTWRVTGTVEAVEAFRVSVGGVVIPDTDIVAVKTAGEVAKEVAEKTEQVAVLQKNLYVAMAELADLQTVVAVKPVLVESVLVEPVVIKG